MGTGRVWYVMGTSVILTLPNGENKQYNVKSDYKFTVNGSPATVFDLKPGMVVAAEKIVEEPTVEFATNARVVGQTPGSQYTAPASAAPAGALTPAKAPAAPPAKLPKTGSPVPLASLLGLLFVGGSFVIRKFRRQ